MWAKARCGINRCSILLPLIPSGTITDYNTTEGQTKNIFSHSYYLHRLNRDSVMKILSDSRYYYIHDKITAI